MTFEDKAGIVISQLREDRDRLQNIIDKIREEINSPNRGTCDYFIVDQIEEIIEKYDPRKAIVEQDGKEAGYNRTSESNNFTLTEEEKIICKMYLEDLDKTGGCNEYKLLMKLIESAKPSSKTAHENTEEKKDR